MNWEALGAIGEIVGAMGVIATLIYLAIQIRQNTEQQKKNELATQASAVNASAVALRDVRRDAYQDSELTAIFLKGMAQPDELSENEYTRFRLLIQNTLDGIWDIHSRTTVSGVSAEIWESVGMKAVQRVISTQGGRMVWSQFREAYPNKFRLEIDRILESSE